MKLRWITAQALKLFVLMPTVLIPVTTRGATPDGFVIYSKGDAHDRTLYMRPMTSSGGLEAEQLICQKGSRGGDIGGQISFDGTMLAFARSTGCADNEYGGDDYHDFECWDVYVVRLDGGLPASPTKVGRGYWPSWGDDSHNSTKTLYYSTHSEGAVRAVTVSSSGSLSNDRLIYNVKNSSLVDDYEGFLMAGPTGEWAAFRNDGTVYIGHWAGELAGQRVGGNGGCMPSVTADGVWIINARGGSCQRSDGYDGGNIGGDGAGPYHYGTSADMEWFVTRTDCGASKQNLGCNLYLFKLTATNTSLSSQQQEHITDDGSWPDVHAGPLSREVSIASFSADPSTIAEGSSSTLSWSVHNATSLTLNGETVSGDSKTVTPSSTTDYTLTAQGDNGPVSETVTVTVSPSELTTITLSPEQASIYQDETVDFSAATLDQSGNPFDASLSWSVSGGGSLSSSSGTSVTFTSDGTVGEFTVTVQSEGVEASATVTVTDPDALHLKINCGSNDYDVSGWERDDEYMSGGEDFNFGGSCATEGVENAAPEGVYLSVVHFQSEGTTHTYDFPSLPDGSYTVRLHFNDKYGGDRKMNYAFEGQTLISNLDIDDEAGGTNKALVKEVDVAVEDGNGLQIECSGSDGSDVFECGIEVIAWSSGAVATPGSNVSASASMAGGLRYLTLPTGGFSVSISTPQSYSIEVLDLQGRSVFREVGFGPSEIAWPGTRSAGTYVLRIRHGRSVVRKRLVLR